MMDPNAGYGQNNGPLGMAQGSQGVPNGALGAMLGGTQSALPGGGQGGAQAALGGSAMLDPGTFAALQAILPVLARTPAEHGGLMQAQPQAGASKNGQPTAAPSKSTGKAQEHPLVTVLSQLLNSGGSGT